MTVAKTKNPLFSSSPGRFSPLRGPLRQPAIPDVFDQAMFIPDAGVIDLSDTDCYQQPLPPGLLSAVAPLSAVCENNDQVAARRQLLFDQIVEDISDRQPFLPPRFQGAPLGSIDTLYNGYAEIINRHGDEESRFRAPFEVLVRERYRGSPPSNVDNYGFGIGHYVYDPITEQWFLVQRWGRGQADQDGQIEPYVQWGGLGNRFKKVLASIVASPLPAVSEQFTAVSPDGLRDSWSRWRKRR